MSLPRYPKYKDSGVEWLGEVPAHWELTRLCQLGTVLKGSGASKEDVVDTGIPCVRYGDLYTTHSFSIHRARTCVTAERAAEYTPILCGDVLFAASGETLEDIGKSAVNLMAESACCGGDIIILRPTADCDPTFLGYACDAQPSTVQKAAMGRGTIIKHISAGDIKNLGLAVPPLAEQAQIAKFLDRETAKIDALMAEQQRLIELLKEKRQAVISHAVTKGLNPNAPMKDSGFEWLGEVPAHWEVKALKHSITQIEQGWSPQCENGPAEDGEWGVLKVGCGNGDNFDETEQKALPLDLVPEERYEVKSGDILMSRGNTPGLVGAATLVKHVRPRLLLSDLLYRFRARADRADAAFLVHSLRSGHARFQIGRNAVGTSHSMKKIGQGVIRELVIPLPPITEQSMIVRHIDDGVAVLDTLTAEATRAIDLLTERRTALISAAVTGQIDVRPRAQKT